MEYLTALWQHEPAGILMIFSLSSFLIGLLSGYFLSIRRKRELSAAIQDSENERLSLQQQLTTSTRQHQLLQADLRKSTFEAAEALALAKRLQQEIQDKDQDLKILEAELKRITTDNTTLIDKLQDQKKYASPTSLLSMPGEASTISTSLSRMEALLLQFLRQEEDMHRPDKRADDPGLLILEGMSPDSVAILKSANITSMQQLADTSPESLIQLLAHRHHTALIASWPNQAKLALDGQWDTLRDFQHRLKGGKASDQ
jgi:hypothetical protein